MKKLLFAAGLLCFGLSTTTFAQDLKQSGSLSQAQATSRLDPKRMAAMRANRLEKELALTPEQKSKVEDIITQVMTNQKDRQAAEKEAEQKIKTVLTPEQSQKYDEMISKRQELKKEQLDATHTK